MVEKIDPAKADDTDGFDFSGRSIVILTPAYNDWRSLETLLPRLDSKLAPLGVHARVVIVDDGSTDFSGRDAIASSTFAAIDAVDVINLTRNQGNQRAIAIGIGYIAESEDADFLIVMDSDHEDDPKYIPDMLRRCVMGNESAIVFSERTRRSEGLQFRFLYWCYQRLFKLFTGSVISFGNYCAVPRSLIIRLANVEELWTHFSAAIIRSRIPFASIPAIRGTRSYGKSSMSMVPLIGHAFGAFSVFAEQYAARLMVFSAALSVVIFMTAIFLASLRIFTDIPISGWTSVIIVLLFVMLIQLVAISKTVMFNVLILRARAPMIPLVEYSQFINTVTSVYCR